MKKYDIISDYSRFECAPGVYIPVDLVSSGETGRDEQNVRWVQGQWTEVWPATLSFLRELRTQYDFDPAIDPSGMRAKLMLADARVAEDGRWEVSFTVEEDGYGEWGVGFVGSVLDRESSQPYF